MDVQRLTISLAVLSTTAALWLAVPGDALAQRPSWYVSFDPLALDRDAPGPPPPATPPPPPPPPPDEEEEGEGDPEWDVGFDLQSNFRVKIFHEPTPGCGWEVSFLRNEWDFAQTRMDPGGINKVTGAPAFLGATSVTAQYQTELNTLEVNRHVNVYCDCTLFGGFRALWLDEDFRLTSRHPMTGTGTYDVDTENGLYGGQIGATYFQWAASDLWFSVIGKAGIFSNDAQQRVALVDPNIPNIIYANGDTATAFVGEIDVNATYFVYSDFAVRAGFLMLWVDRVALALEQVQNTTAALPRPIYATGGLFAYGFYVGGEASW